MLFIRSFIWPKRTLNLSERGLCGLQHKKESKKQRKTLHSHHHELRILRTIVLAFVNCGGRAHSLHLFRPHFYTQFSISHAPHLPAVRWAKSSLFSSVFMKNEKQHWCCCHSLSLSLRLICLRANQPKRNKHRLDCSWQRNINKNHIELHHERKEGNEFKFAFHVIYGGNDFYSRLALAHGEKKFSSHYISHTTTPSPSHPSRAENGE